MFGEDFLVEYVLDCCFVSISRTIVISKLLNVPCAAISQHLAKFNAEVLLPLILAHYNNEVGILVLFDYLCHRVRNLKVIYRGIRTCNHTIYYATRDACIEKTAVSHTKISAV